MEEINLSERLNKKSIKKLYKFVYRNTIEKLLNLFYKLFAICQRAKKGYSNIDVYDFSEQLPIKILNMLKEYKENMTAHPCLLSIEDENLKKLSEKELGKKQEKYWDDIIKELIFRFQESTEKTAQHINNPYEPKGEMFFIKEHENDKFYTMEIRYNNEEEKIESENYLEREREIEEYLKNNKKLAFEMLAKYIEYIWD